MTGAYSPIAHRVYAVDAERVRDQLARPILEEYEPDAEQNDELDPDPIGSESLHTCETDLTESEYPGAHPKSSRAQPSRGTLSGVIPARGGKGSGKRGAPRPIHVLMRLVKDHFRHTVWWHEAARESYRLDQARQGVHPFSAGLGLVLRGQVRETICGDECLLVFAADWCSRT